MRPRPGIQPRSRGIIRQTRASPCGIGVGESEADKLQIEVRRHDPHAALFGGEEGLDVYRRLIPQAREVLKPKGWLVMEIGYSQEMSIRDLLHDWTEVHSVPDLQGIPRVMIARNI